MSKKVPNIKFMNQMRVEFEKSGFHDLKKWAKHLDVAYTTLRNIVNLNKNGQTWSEEKIGHIPRWDILVHLSKKLDKSTDWLLTGKKSDADPTRTFPQEALEAYPHVLEGIIREVREAIELGLSEKGLAKAIGTEMQKKIDIFTDLKKVNASHKKCYLFSICGTSKPCKISGTSKISASEMSPAVLPSGNLRYSKKARVIFLDNYR